MQLNRVKKLGKIEGRRRKDDIFGWHDWLDGHEFEQVLWVGDGQGSLACCSPWGHKELDMTEQLTWTEQHFIDISIKYCSIFVEKFLALADGSSFNLTSVSSIIILFLVFIYWYIFFLIIKVTLLDNLLDWFKIRGKTRKIPIILVFYILMYFLLAFLCIYLILFFIAFFFIAF